MAGVPVVPRGQHPCAQVRLFVFPLPLVGVELGHKYGSCSFLGLFLQALLPLQVPSS
jgi:hypothetical protein